MKLAVLGMGNMGRSIAGRLLQAGHEVTVWNRTPGKAGELAASGAREAGSPAEAMKDAEAAIMSLSDDDAVLDLVTGEAKLAEQLAEGAVLVDASTVSPSTSRTEAGATGIHRFVAAPVLGAPAAVADGNALYLLGGPGDAVDRLDPAWSALSEHRFHTGDDPGSATSVKLMCNYLLMGGIDLLSEVVAMAQAYSMDDEVILKLFGSLPVVPPALHNRLEDIVRGDHKGWFPARLGAKDVGLAKELAEDLGVSLHLGDAVQAPYLELIDQGRGELDVAAAVETVRRREPTQAQQR